MNGLILFYIIFLGLYLIVGLAGYLLKGLGMYGIAKQQNLSYAWLAFIPVASNYLQGRLAGESLKIGKKEWKNPGLWMLLIPIIFYAVFFTVYIIFIISIALQGSADYLDKSPAAVQALISGMIGFIVIIMLLAIIGGTAVNLITGLVRYNIHKRYQDDNKALLHMLLGMFVPLYQSIYFFILRNKIPIDMQTASEEEMFSE
ncbi:hypothetical protein [Acetivibrio sp. MSJd-27]|jgi:hypothetical protein|uniref:hypothetical protein n=1 Tax=Acetivibrio sp. MSJd-27 TaxID=2841523 RepID=UPI0015AE6D14|nr:hypothetical protein [Acetivibrio sp. MSJd-27]MBU5450166.1 hypothetical protein [Acetivibrio sp. MSJd-27]